ncbi:cyclic nucleotide gated channel beta 1 [Branchiostoma belcheri]|nr:cyclic nucleotide gated channel beta 1 [Branchiostoma belcheri]
MAYFGDDSGSGSGSGSGSDSSDSSDDEFPEIMAQANPEEQAVLGNLAQLSGILGKANRGRDHGNYDDGRMAQWGDEEVEDPHGVSDHLQYLSQPQNVAVLEKFGMLDKMGPMGTALSMMSKTGGGGVDKGMLKFLGKGAMGGGHGRKKHKKKKGGMGGLKMGALAGLGGMLLGGKGGGHGKHHKPKPKFDLSDGFGMEDMKALANMASGSKGHKSGKHKSKGIDLSDGIDASDIFAAGKMFLKK